MDSATYELQLTGRFRKDFESLKGASLRERIKRELEALQTDPHMHKRLHENLKGFWSMRVGKYRIVYAVDEHAKRAVLYFLGHRKGIYDRY